jgi:tRNA A-37 threonylcarbamoyl transferase component Bud32
MTQLWEEFTEFKHSFDRDTTRYIKVARDWDTPMFRKFLINIEEHLGQGQAIHDYRNVLVRIDQNEELGVKKEILVKKYKLFRKYDRLRFCFISSKAQRSLEIALFLLNNGVNTPAPIAVIDDRGKFNRLLNCYYLTEYLDYDVSFLQIIKEADENRKRKILMEAAQNIRLMHDVGIVHKDLHATNILVKNQETHTEFYFIDLNRARKKECLTLEARAKDLGRLALQQYDKLIFFKSYDPQHYECLIQKSHKSFARRKKWIAFKDKIRRLKSKLN